MSLFLALVPSAVYAQPSNSSCKKPLEVTLKDLDGRDVVAHYNSNCGWSVLSRDTVMIYPNGEVFAEAEDSQTGPKDLREVDKIVHPEKTFVFNLRQIKDPSEGYVMQLTVKNPFPQYLKYDLEIMSVHGEEYASTPTCAVKPNGTSIETWPAPLYKVGMSNMVFLKQAPGSPCDGSHSQSNKSAHPPQ
jgi:hypothetical protein